MYSLTFVTLVMVVVVNLFCASPVTSLRSSHRRRDLDTVKPVSELGWKVPLLSGKCHNGGIASYIDSAHCVLGTHALPLPAADKKLTYLTVGRGIMTYQCNSTKAGDNQPAYLYQNTDLYDVAPLAQNLPDEEALHALVPQLCEYDYAELRNTSISCVGRIYSQFGRTIVDLYGFNVPKFATELTWAIPSPAGQTISGYWDHSATIDKDWEVYRVETAGGVTPTSCKGHENSTFNVAYAAEYWFYHR